MDEHLRANPVARQHARVIKDTLKALDDLQKAGLTPAGYELGPAYGGSRAPADQRPRKAVAQMKKMTYCA